MEVIVHPYPFKSSFYHVSLEEITIGKTLLPMPKLTLKLKEDGIGGMIIDFGTTLTYLQGRLLGC